MMSPAPPTPRGFSTDTDRPYTGSPTGVASSATLQAASPNADQDAAGITTNVPTDAPIEHPLTHVDEEARQVASIYLDAQEDGPDIEQILQELRAMPDPPSRAISSPASAVDLADMLRGNAHSVSSTAPAADSGEDARDPSASANLAVAHGDSQGDAERDIPSRSSIQQRRRSSRMSMSSIATRQSRIFTPLRVSTTLTPPAVASAEAELAPDIGAYTADPGAAQQTVVGRASSAEVTVELHEERASAFHDFLFWAYPHLECKVTWGNVEDVRLQPMSPSSPTRQRPSVELPADDYSSSPCLSRCSSRLCKSNASSSSCPTRRASQ